MVSVIARRAPLSLDHSDLPYLSSLDFHHLTLGDCPLSIDHSDLLSFIPVPISFVQMTVVMLNSRNWRREVEESGHAVFINVCRQG